MNRIILLAFCSPLLFITLYSKQRQCYPIPRVQRSNNYLTTKTSPFQKISLAIPFLSFLSLILPTKQHSINDMLAALLPFLAILAPAYAQVTATFPNGVTNPPAPSFYPIGAQVNQSSVSRLLTLNSVDDFCIYGPPEPGPDSLIGEWRFWNHDPPSKISVTFPSTTFPHRSLVPPSPLSTSTHLCGTQR